MRKQRILMFVLVFLLLPCISAARAQSIRLIAAPDVLRPGKYHEITVEASYDGYASLLLLDQSGEPYYAIYSGYPLSLGENKMGWDGRRADQSVVEQGEYILSLQMDDGTKVDSPIRIGAPYPMLTQIVQDDSLLTASDISISFHASDAGLLNVQLLYTSDNRVEALAPLDVQSGANSYIWNGEGENGVRVPTGEYALVMTLRAPTGMESMSEYVYVHVQNTEVADSQGFQLVDRVYADELPPDYLFDAANDGAPSFTMDNAIENNAPLVSSPYSGIGDGTYWSMTPGELDDKTIWDILMQPIIVYDDGKLSAKEHAYLMENPDGTGAKIAQLHATSQGLHVIGEPNEYGYVLVEAFSNYDREYMPQTDEERAVAFDLKQGYVKAEYLKTIEVMPDMALLIDKLTQRMYLFIEGERVTELVISTGIITGNDYLFETISGEFITVSHTGTLVDGNMNSALAIRINGGILIHEVPHKLRDSGKKDYSAFEAYLGTKQSHGCIRVQRLKNEDGYNQQWIWDNFRRGRPYKVIIWDDRNRVDTPETWYPNPS